MIFEKNNMLGSMYWLNSESKSFNKIQEDSYVTEHWRKKNVNFDDKIIKPVNLYAEYFAKKPKLIKKNNNFYLRQYTHAEIWVEKKDNGLYALDKTMQRQFYPSDIVYNINKNCFSAQYKFYTPWIIDQQETFPVFSIKNSPFVIYSNNVTFIKNEINVECLTPQWIYFGFKNTKKYLKENKYYIIEIGTPMFDILIDNKIILKRIIKEYEK